MPTVFVYSSLIFFMLLCFSFARQLSPYARNLYDTENVSVAYVVFFVLPLLAMAYTFGIRYNVGADHLNYLNIYLYGYRWRQHELLYVMIMNIFALCKAPYPLFFGFMTLLQASFFFVAFRKEPQLLVWLVLFLFFDGLVGSWNNIIRASIAGCIWIYSIDYIVDRKLVRYLICNLIAVGFHNSAVILFVAYPLFFQGRDYFSRIKLQYILLAVALVIRVTFFRFSSQISSLIDLFAVILPRYESYTADKIMSEMISHQNVGSSMAFYLVIVINIIIIAYSKRLHAYYNSKRFNIIYNIYFIGVFTFYMFPFGFFSLTRPFRFFYFFRPIMLAYFALYLYENRRRLSEFWTLVIVLISFTGIFYGSMLYNSSENLSKYPTYVQHPEVPLKPSYKPHSIFRN